MKHVDLIGKTFGKLTVVKQVPGRAHKTSWLCVCECGNFKITITNALTRGDTQSCGCLRKGKKQKEDRRISILDYLDHYGASTSTEIAEGMGFYMTRCKAYNALIQLEDQGKVFRFTKNGQLYWDIAITEAQAIINKGFEAFTRGLLL